MIPIMKKIRTYFADTERWTFIEGSINGAVITPGSQAPDHLHYKERVILGNSSSLYKIRTMAKKVKQFTKNLNIGSTPMGNAKLEFDLAKPLSKYSITDAEGTISGTTHDGVKTKKYLDLSFTVTEDLKGDLSKHFKEVSIKGYSMKFNENNPSYHYDKALDVILEKAKTELKNSEEDSINVDIYDYSKNRSLRVSFAVAKSPDGYKIKDAKKTKKLTKTIRL